MPQVTPWGAESAFCCRFQALGRPTCSSGRVANPEAPGQKDILLIRGARTVPAELGQTGSARATPGSCRPSARSCIVGESGRQVCEYCGDDSECRRHRGRRRRGGRTRPLGSVDVPRLADRQPQGLPAMARPAPGLLLSLMGLLIVAVLPGRRSRAAPATAGGQGLTPPDPAAVPPPASPSAARAPRRPHRQLRRPRTLRHQPRLRPRSRCRVCQAIVARGDGP